MRPFTAKSAAWLLAVGAGCGQAAPTASVTDADSGTDAVSAADSGCRPLSPADGVCCCKSWIKLVCVEGKWLCTLGPAPIMGSCDDMIEGHYQQLCPGFGANESDETYPGADADSLAVDATADQP